MKNFVVRIELHDANQSDYERLHELMEGKGYSQTIRGSNGRFFKLPPAEYIAENKPFDFTASKARDEAVSVAKSVKQNPSVLAVECADLAWQLPMV